METQVSQGGSGAPRSALSYDSGVVIDSNANIVITLVHGTFAPHAPWCGARSFLRKELKEKLGPALVDFYPFGWSGGNSHSARGDAAEALAKKLAQLHAAAPRARHFIVAHSHGGNIALAAVSRLPDPDIISGIVNMGTPYLNARERDLQGSSGIVSVLLTAAGGAIGMMISTPFMIITTNLLLRWLDKGMEWPAFIVGAFIMLGFVMVGVEKAQELWNGSLKHKLYDRAIRVASFFDVRRASKTPLLSIQVPWDEARTGLNLFERPSNVPFIAFSRITQALTKATSSFPVFFAWFGVISALAGLSLIIEYRDTLWPTIQQVHDIGSFFDVAALIVLPVFFALVLVMIVALFVLMAVVPRIRSHRLGFGPEALLDYMVVRLTADTKPFHHSNISHQVIPVDRSLLDFHGEPSLIRHCFLYDSRYVITLIADWIGTRAVGLCKGS